MLNEFRMNISTINSRQTKRCGIYSKAFFYLLELIFFPPPYFLSLGENRVGIAVHVQLSMHGYLVPAHRAVIVICLCIKLHLTPVISFTDYSIIYEYNQKYIEGSLKTQPFNKTTSVEFSLWWLPWPENFTVSSTRHKLPRTDQASNPIKKKVGYPHKLPYRCCANNRSVL